MVARFWTRMERCQRWARKPVIARVSCDGQLADGQWNNGGNQAAEGHQQKREGGGDDQTFGAVNVVGAGFADVEVEWDLSSELQLYGWIADRS